MFSSILHVNSARKYGYLKVFIQSKKMTLIRQCYQVRYKNNEGNGSPISAGLGDILRGCFFLWQLSQKLDLDFRIYFRNHPTLSLFLESDEPQLNIDPLSVQFYSHYTEKDIVAGQDNNICTNACGGYNNYVHGNVVFPTECKAFIRSKLRMTESFKAKFEALIGNIGPYNVIQMRLGDPVGPKEIPDHLMTRIHNVLTQIPKDQVTYIISDNPLIRDRLAETYQLRTLRSKACHLGAITEVNDIEAMEGTMTDFFLMSRASHIYNFSTYHGPSGFSTWVSQIFDVPFTFLKL
jgi:hypothetical protein